MTLKVGKIWPNLVTPRTAPTWRKVQCDPSLSNLLIGRLNLEYFGNSSISKKVRVERVARALSEVGRDSGLRKPNPGANLQKTFLQ